MSYNYDANPWDDNYSSVQSTGNYSNSATGYSDSAGGYNNPIDQYGQYQSQDPQQQQQQQYDDGSAAADEQQPQQQQQQQPSAIGRFLRQHVPICGSFMDLLSGINLPFLDALVRNVNPDLLVSKMFYFFFYSAFGSLFPLMGVYFKQLGMNPAQVGILTGVRPFIEIFSAPFWNSLAERFHKSKALLLFSVLCWIVFTYSLAHIRPPASACVAFNDTDYVLYTPYSANDLSNYEVAGQQDESGTEQPANELFINKPPTGGGETTSKERESKEGILASEENQNDQRRRRRSVGGGQREQRFHYGFEESPESGEDAYRMNPDLELDLEGDFEDRPVGQHSAGASSSFFESDNENAAGQAEYDELEQMYKKGSRFERSLGAKDIDDMLGESEKLEPEDEEEEESVGQHDRMAAKEKDNRAKEETDEERRENDEPPGERKMDGEAKQNGHHERGPIGTSQPSTSTTEMNSFESTPSQEIKPANKTKKVYKQRHKTPPTHIVGMSPITVEYAINYKKERHSQFVTPMFSTIVYKLDDIKEVFFLLLLLISLGEFFSAPALTLADSATLSYLGDNTDLYGRQRMFGSLSWAITLLLVGMALDNATSIADHPCGPHQRERSYTVCFIIFSLLMACAFLTATQFKFNYQKGGSAASGSQTLMASTTDSNTVITTTVDGSKGATGNIDELYASTQPRSIFNTAPPVNTPPPSVIQQGGKEKFEFLDKWKSAVFAQRTRDLPEWVNVFRQFRNSLHLTYLFITWFLGCGVGLVFTFLFWHLQDVGGTPTLFGICSVINHISEILAYFFSFSFIKRFGHTRVLSVGLGCNVIRFLYVAFLTDPYYALPFELVQGITHAACFAACCSYISHVSKPELRTSTQGVMQGLHHGIGRACGALIGGYMINAIGSRASFCIYGLLSGCVLAGFLYIRKKVSESEDEEVKVDDSEALGGYGAPQGVPSAIPGKIGPTVSNQEIDYQW